MDDIKSKLGIDSINASIHEQDYFKNQLCRDENNSSMFQKMGSRNNIEGFNRYMNIL